MRTLPGNASVRSSAWYAVLPLCAAMLAACDSSTSQNSCNLPAETASILPAGRSTLGVVQRIKVGGIGTTPGGYDPYTQVDAFVTIPVNASTASATVDIAIGKGTPVLMVLNGHAPEPLSACGIHVGDKVAVWAGLDGVIPGGWVNAQGDTVSLNDVTFAAQQLIIVRGY
jgi:hypothetical protein